MEIIKEIYKLNEAYAVRRNIPITRKYSDGEIEQAQMELDLAEEIVDMPLTERK